MVMAARTTVTMAWALSLAPTEAMDPMSAVWIMVKPTSCHFSWCRREQMKTTTRPAARIISYRPSQGEATGVKTYSTFRTKI